MLVNIRDVVVSVLIFLLFLLGVVLIFSNTIKTSPFSISSFLEGQNQFETCAIDYIEKNQQATEIKNNEFIYWEDEHIEKEFYKFTFESSCNTNYLSSDSNQISAYALEAVNYAAKLLEDENSKMIDVVYTTSKDYYAYLSEPQEYLFFVMDTNQKKMLAIIVQPNLDGSNNVMSVWDVNDSGSDETIKNYTKRLLIKYNEKIKFKN